MIVKIVFPKEKKKSVKANGTFSDLHSTFKYSLKISLFLGIAIFFFFRQACYCQPQRDLWRIFPKQTKMLFLIAVLSNPFIQQKLTKFGWEPIKRLETSIDSSFTMAMEDDG